MGRAGWAKREGCWGGEERQSDSKVPALPDSPGSPVQCILVLPGKAFAHIPGTYTGDYSFHSCFACTSSASSEETSW